MKPNSPLRHVALAALVCGVAFATSAAAQNVGQEGYTFQRGAVAALTDEVRTPRFQVRLISFTANDETGPDWSGSDEIYAVYETANYRAATSVYGDIDTGDTQRINLRHNCAVGALDPDGLRNQRWRCDIAGVPGPIEFSISLYETDGNSPFRSGACLAGGTTDLAPRNATQCSLESRQRVFHHQRTFTEQALLTLLPEPNQQREFVVDGDQYTITFRVDRKADVVTQADRAIMR